MQDMQAYPNAYIHNHDEVNNKENLEPNQKRKILKGGRKKLQAFLLANVHRIVNSSIAWSTIQYSLGGRKEIKKFVFQKNPPNPPRLYTAATFPPELGHAARRWVFSRASHHFFNRSLQRLVECIHTHTVTNFLQVLFKVVPTDDFNSEFFDPLLFSTFALCPFRLNGESLSSVL